MEGTAPQVVETTTGGGKRGPTTWTFPTVYATPDGESHFGEKEVRLSSGGSIGTLSELMQLKGVIFRSTPADYDFNWHCAPCNQLIVNLNASVEVEVTNGEKRVFQQGEIFLVEDTTGKGHRSRSIDGKMRFSLFLPLPDS